MFKVGTSHVKAHLTELLERVAKGERIVITRRGKPVAMIVPPQKHSQTHVAAVVHDMLTLRDQHGPKLGRDLSVRRLVEEGRRF